MKKIFIYLFLIFLVSECNKDPFDPRTKYLGNYRFLIHEVDWWAGDGHLDTTYYTDGGIDYGYDKNAIAIHWPEMNPGPNPELFEDASFEGMGVSGEFYSTKKVGFTFFIERSSFTNTFYVTGNKKN